MTTNQGAPARGSLGRRSFDPQVLTSEAWETIAAKRFERIKVVRRA